MQQNKVIASQFVQTNYPDRIKQCQRIIDLYDPPTGETYILQGFPYKEGYTGLGDPLHFTPGLGFYFTVMHHVPGSPRFHLPVNPTCLFYQS